MVYISPLKALSNDIERNLERPLVGILERLRASGEPGVEIRTAERTVETVIVDEIHAMVDVKRGSHLAVTLERLAHLTARAALGAARTRDVRRGSSASARSTAVSAASTVRCPTPRR